MPQGKYHDQVITTNQTSKAKIHHLIVLWIHTRLRVGEWSGVLYCSIISEIIIQVVCNLGIL